MEPQSTESLTSLDRAEQVIAELESKIARLEKENAELRAQLAKS